MSLLCDKGHLSDSHVKMPLPYDSLWVMCSWNDNLHWKFNWSCQSQLALLWSIYCAYQSDHQQPRIKAIMENEFMHLGHLIDYRWIIHLFNLLERHKMTINYLVGQISPILIIQEVKLPVKCNRGHLVLHWFVCSALNDLLQKCNEQWLYGTFCDLW